MQRIDQFSEDLENFLESRPIRARKTDTWYQARNFCAGIGYRLRRSPVAIAGLSRGNIRRKSRASHRTATVSSKSANSRIRFIELHDDVAKLPARRRSVKKW